MSNANKIKQQQQLEFYTAVSSMNRDDMLQYCTNLILNARAPNYTLVDQLQNMSKDRMIIAVNNFIMKGHGYGV